MPEETEQDGLSEVEIALMDALKTMLEVLMFAHPGMDQYFERSFAEQAQGKFLRDQPKAAALFELLRQFAADPERRASREQLATFLSEQPKGRA